MSTSFSPRRPVKAIVLPSGDQTGVGVVVGMAGEVEGRPRAIDGDRARYLWLKSSSDWAVDEPLAVGRPVELRAGPTT